MAKPDQLLIIEPQHELKFRGKTHIFPKREKKVQEKNVLGSFDSILCVKNERKKKKNDGSEKWWKFLLKKWEIRVKVALYASLPIKFH